MAIFRDPLAASLRLAGFETACAANGREALAAVRAKRPDLILLDLAMPVMDGLSFLRTMRASGDGPIPIVVLSAASDPRQAFEAGSLGAGDYLVKSNVSLDDMLRHVRTALARDVPPEPRSVALSPPPDAPGAAPAPPPPP